MQSETPLSDSFLLNSFIHSLEVDTRQLAMVNHKDCRYRLAAKDHGKAQKIVALVRREDKDNNGSATSVTGNFSDCQQALDISQEYISQEARINEEDKRETTVPSAALLSARYQLQRRMWKQQCDLVQQQREAAHNTGQILQQCIARVKAYEVYNKGREEMTESPEKRQDVRRYVLESREKHDSQTSPQEVIPKTPSPRKAQSTSGENCKSAHPIIDMKGLYKRAFEVSRAEMRAERRRKAVASKQIQSGWRKDGCVVAKEIQPVARRESAQEKLLLQPVVPYSRPAWREEALQKGNLLYQLLRPQQESRQHQTFGMPMIPSVLLVFILAGILFVAALVWVDGIISVKHGPQVFLL